MDSGSRVGLQIVLGDEKGLGDDEVLGDLNVLGDLKVLGDLNVLGDDNKVLGDVKVLGDDNKVLGDDNKVLGDDKVLGALGVLSGGLQAPHSAVPATGETVPPGPETERAVHLGALPPAALAPTTDDDDNKCPFFAVGLRSLRDSPDAPAKEEDPQQTEEEALLAERMKRSPFINWRAVAKLEKECGGEGEAEG